MQEGDKIIMNNKIFTPEWIKRAQKYEDCLAMTFEGFVEGPKGESNDWDDEYKDYCEDRYEDLRGCSYSDNGSFSGHVYYKVEGGWAKFFVAS